VFPLRRTLVRSVGMRDDVSRVDITQISGDHYVAHVPYMAHNYPK